VNKAIGALFFIIFLSSCGSQAISNQKKDKNLENLEKLNSAANVLMLISDEVISLDECKINPELSLKMLQPLHAMIDENIKKNFGAYTDLEDYNCEENCQCGIYSDISNISSTKDNLIKRAKGVSQNQLKKCALESAKWLCNSKLILKLKSEIEPDLESL
jgi:hypothetical protein